MTTWTRVGVVALMLGAGPVGCDSDSGSGSDSGADDGGDDGGGDDDGGDDDGGASGDIFTHVLEVGAFTYSETLVNVWGRCTTVRTAEGEGSSDCSTGTIFVGVPGPEGNLVTGGLALCGRLTVTEETTPADCEFDSTTTLEKTAVALISLTAAQPDDPMELHAPKMDQPDLNLSTMIFAATALDQVGAAKTLVLDAAADADDQTWGTIHREVHFDIDIVVGE